MTMTTTPPAQASRPASCAESTDASDATASTGAKRRERLREQTDRKIMQATLQIATQQGIGAVSIEEVSRRSGVAKTTIYRRYRNTADMLHKVETLNFSGSNTLHDLQASRENLQLLLQRITEYFNAAIGIKAVGLVLSSENEYFDRLVEQAIMPEQTRLADFIKQGVRSGVFREGIDAQFLFNTIVGSMVACQVLPGTADSWARRMAMLIWPAMAA